MKLWRFLTTDSLPEPEVRPNPASAPQSVSEWAKSALNFHADPQQQPVLDCDAKRVIVLAARQVGKSTIAALRALYLAVHRPKSLICMVGPLGNQAGEILHRAREFAGQLGLPLRGDGHNALSLQLPNGSRIVARPAVPDSLRSYSKAALLIIDEAAFVKEEAYRAVSPVLTAGQGSFWVISTPRGPEGLFADLWHDHQNGWTRFQLRADHCPRFTKEALAAERQLHGELSFAQEYQCRFLSHGLQLLTRDQIAAAIIEKLVPPIPVLQQKTELYIGLDLGKRQDHTALIAAVVTFTGGVPDPATRAVPLYPKFTVLYAARLPLDTETTNIPRFVRDAVQRYRPHYALPGHVPQILVDATGGGHTVVELLRKDNPGAQIKPITITGGQTAHQLKDSYMGVPRTDLIGRLKLFFETGMIQIERTAPGFEILERELQRFEPSGDQQEHDDLVMALALAVWQAAKDHPNLVGLAHQQPIFSPHRLL